MKRFITILISASSLTWASDCTFLKDGEVVRLDVKGKSLESFKVQDQDGLSSCYANSASAVLQSILPNHPEVSYLDLAINYKIDGLKAIKSRLSNNDVVDIYTKKTNSRTGPAFEYGSGCLAIKNVIEHQKAQGKAVLCPRDAVNIESKYSSKDNRWIQFENMLNASVYMNEFQTAFKLNTPENQKKYQDFKESLSKVIGDQKNEFKLSDCNKISPSGNNVFFNLLVQIMGNDDSCLKDQTLNTATCRIIRTIADSPTIDENGVVNFKGYGKSFLNDLNTEILSTSASVTPKKLQDVMLSLLKTNAALNEEEAGNLVLAMEKIPENLLERQIDEINDIKKNGFSTVCAEQKTLKYLSSDSFKDDWGKDIALCSNSKVMTSLSKLIQQYRLADLGNFDKIVDFILKNAALDYDEAIKSLYAVDCDDKNKILVPENLSCERLNLDYAKEKDKEKLNEAISTSLKNNTPVIGSMCSNIYDGAVVAEELETDCHAHAVVVIGMKCVDGKNQFLIQNSWGSEFIPKNKALIPEEGKGSAWFDEKSMGDVFYAFEVFK
ncbi:MAG: C1 family peptidase [Bacteriovorax sp.]